MGRKVRRVPLDFGHPVGQVWPGFLRPDRFREDDCPDCPNGYSPHAQRLLDLWYGKLPFDPAITGSTPLTPDTPAVRAFAERNVSQSPEFYGADEVAIVTEARRLAGLWNGQWCHHLDQADVDALLAADRLWDFTRPRPAGGGRRTTLDPPPTVTAAQVNEWSLRGLGHGCLNADTVIRARCERDGAPVMCATCDGHGSLEAWPGQRAEAEAWEPTDPPQGEGWQLWETVSEGSPISPVLATADELAAWMAAPERGRNWVPQETAAHFIAEGWAPSGFFSPRTGFVTGVEYVGRQGEANDGA